LAEAVIEKEVGSGGDKNGITHCLGGCCTNIDPVPQKGCKPRNRNQQDPPEVSTGGFQNCLFIGEETQNLLPPNKIDQSKKSGQNPTPSKNITNR